MKTRSGRVVNEINEIVENASDSEEDIAETAIKYDNNALVSKKPKEGLGQFDMPGAVAALEHSPMVTIIGQRTSGKMVIMNELIFHLDKKFKYEEIMIFSQTAKMNGDFPFAKPDYVFDTLDALPKIIQARKESGSKKHILLIFDDVAGMTSMGANGKRKTIKYNEELDFLSTTARHYHFSVIVSVQNRVMVSKVLRNNSSLSFIFTPKSRDDTQNIHNEYLGLARSRNEAQAIFDSVYSKPFNTLVVEGYKSGVRNVTDYVSEYIAPFPLRKYKTHSLRKAKREQSKAKKKKKQEEEMFKQQEKANTLGLNFRVSIYSDEIRRRTQQNSENERAINIYGEQLS